MPMIPAGRVDEVQVVERPLPPIAMPVAVETDSCICLYDDGSIDPKATTNRFASVVQEALETAADCKDPVFCAGVAILAGQKLRFRFGKISDFTGLPRQFCRRVVNNLGYSGLIFNRELAGELGAELGKAEPDEVTLRFLLVLYCLAGAGQVKYERGLGWTLIKGRDSEFYTIAEVA